MPDLDRLTLALRRIDAALSGRSRPGGTSRRRYEAVLAIVATAVLAGAVTVLGVRTQALDHARVWQVLLPALGVLVARVADVTLGVLRTVFIVSGRRASAGMAAATETAVWLAAASVVLSDLTPVKAVAYCAGVGLGTVVGMGVVRAAKWGVVTMRIFVPEGQGREVAALLHERGLGATVFAGHGRHGPRDMVMAMMLRREAAQVTRELADRPDTFCVSDTEAVVGTISGTRGRV